jgi:hypothetical protein
MKNFIYACLIGFTLASISTIALSDVAKVGRHLESIEFRKIHKIVNISPNAPVKTVVNTESNVLKEKKKDKSYLPRFQRQLL